MGVLLSGCAAVDGGMELAKTIWGSSTRALEEARGYLVLMGIKGSVNTTEVGVFFVEVNDTQTRVEIASLSTNAKRLVAKSLFHGLDVSFGNESKS